ncbi:MAG: Crp/Fnr family transcriptional regulator [Chitinophagaceae bacterium]|jgi:CRP-like cAMP-binding protein|nr:Crp/Fnr family transcriptional regulator [Chitinophagaceae bacterium]
MNIAIINSYIQQLIQMDEKKVQELTQQFEFKEVAKNELILKESQVSNCTFFLESGYIRSYLIDNNGNEVTTNIFSPPCFVNDFLSFFKQHPTHENFQTLTPCIIWTMSFEDVQKNFHSIPEFREFGRMMLVTNFAKLQNRILGMLKSTAENRYLTLMEEHPDVFQNVPLKIIASYLGITDTSLSRIRKEIASK